MQTVRVEYIGKKDQRADTVAGTGTVWLGQGDVQTVPIEAWLRLARHPDVWALAESRAEQTKAAEPPAIIDADADADVDAEADLEAAAAAAGMTVEAWTALTDEERAELAAPEAKTAPAKKATKKAGKA